MPWPYNLDNKGHGNYQAASEPRRHSPTLSQRQIKWKRIQGQGVVNERATTRAWACLMADTGRNVHG